MFRSYVAIALRQLAAQRLYSAINIAGLAIGLAAAMLVGLYVRHELSYDRYHANADRIFRVSRNVSLPNGVFHDASMPAPAAPLLESEFAEIEKTARLRPLDSNSVVTVGEREHIGGWLSATDSELFLLFDFDWIEGERDTALREPFSIVLTASMARRYFGNRPALGETLRLIQSPTMFTVTGVIRDLPDNTHLRFDMLVPMSLAVATSRPDELESWSSGNYHTYVLLRPGADIARVQSRSREFFERHMSDLGRLNDFTALPLAALHLDVLRWNDMKPKGRVATVYASGVIAALILGIACVNFVNLATAAARRRAKEVGVRKTLGVLRGRLIVQFLAESLVLTAIAALIALAAVELLLPVVGAFLEMNLTLDYRSDALTVASLLAVTVLVGLAAGSFPAFYVSAFEPAKVLKGDLTRGRNAALVRSVLVGAQFSISIALVIATAVVYRQTMFMRNVDLGYDKEQIVVVSGSGSGLLAQRWETLKREWLAHPEIVAVTGSSHVPGSNPIRDVIRAEGDPQATPVEVRVAAVDFDFFSTYGIEILAGRGFSADFGADLSDVEAQRSTRATAGAIVNARGARALGWTPEQAVGKTFWGANLDGPDAVPPPGAPVRRIVGVVDDVYFEPLQVPIEPMLFILPRAFFNAASIKVSGRDLEGALAHIDDVWARIVPEQPVERRFLDDSFDAFYRGEQRQAQVLGYGALLAILLASLGLFGLASLTTEQRTKEIGIRKVMGGTIADIVRLFAGEIGRLVLLANLIAWPAAYVAMRRWLDGFPYRIELGIVVFAASGALVLAIAWLTVGAVAARAAGSRPLRALRYE